MPIKKSNRETLLFKKRKLDLVIHQLKKEFIGIDSIIDEVMDSISSWYLFSELQTKPVIINLWGLTGVGKSALVDRISVLLDFDKKHFRFDLGDTKDREWSVKSKLSKAYEHINGFPAIISLDEFQHARTLSDNGGEIDGGISRVIWDLLDSGRFPVNRYTFFIEEIFDLQGKLNYMQQSGVKVKNGIVVEKKEFFKNALCLNTQNKKDDQEFDELRFVPITYINFIFNSAKELFKTENDVKSLLDKMNGEQTIEFINEIIALLISPKVIDCSKCLIFVLGNLDEAYDMSGNFNPDISADEFHEESLKINISKIKKALKNRFRNEQIARLGNIHIIYPAFSSESYRKIIQLELSKINDRIFSLKKVKLVFDDSIVELIYREGVYPSQGTRPIFTTIHQIINSKLGTIFHSMIEQKINPDKIKFSTSKGLLKMVFIKKGKVLYSIKHSQQLNLENLRKNSNDDMQAIIAVHEAGHGVLSCVLMQLLPEIIHSVTAEEGVCGFMHSKTKWKYISKKEILNRVAVLLGGLVAERIVFGDENITTGSESDLQKATAWICRMLKHSGMGNHLIYVEGRNGVNSSRYHDVDDEVNKQVQTILKKAEKMAEKTLNENKVFLLKMADYLSENRFIKKAEIKILFELHVDKAKNIDLIENGDLLFYRKKLKDQIQELTINNHLIREISINHPISMNKSSELIDRVG